MPKLTGVFVALCVSVTPGTVAAQTFNTPTYYIWGEYPSSNYVFTSPLARKFIHANLYYNNFWSNPALAAQWIAAQVDSEIDAGRLLPETVAIMMQNWGMDNSECDSTQGNELNEPTFNGLRFFQPDDRIPGVNEWSGQSNTFPQPRDTSGGRQARAYRHPLIKNAVPDDGSTVRAPLRGWMKQFLTAMNAEWAARDTSFSTLDDIPHPSTYKWYFDTEPGFLGPPSKNSIFLLEQVANSAFWSNSSNPSSHPERYMWAYAVNGVAPTLSDLYEQARQARGWPTAWQGASGLQSQLDYNGLDAASGQNRDIMQWYHEVLDHTAAYVMDHCMFSVLREFYGNEVQCGNYDMFATDGEADTTGWFEDRLFDTNETISNVDWPSFDPSESLLRLRWDKFNGGPMYYQLGGHRWLRTASRCNATAHSPVCYPLSRYELCNTDAIACEDFTWEWCDDPLNNALDKPGHKRRNLWEPLNINGEIPFESFHTSSLRLHRANIESTINSGYSNVVPWTQMAGTDQNGTRPIPDDQLPGESPQISTTSELRDYLRLFRSKNVKEGLLFTAWNVANQPELLPNAWLETQQALSRVYASRVLGYTRTQSTMIGAYADAGESAAVRKTRLEFTLRDSDPNGNGQGPDRVVDLGSKSVVPVQPGDPVQYQTVLTVDFEWPLSQFGSDSFVDDNIFEINVECAVKFSNSATTPVNMTGKVVVWNDSRNCNGGTTNTGIWEEIGYYTFNAPKSADGRYRARVSVATGVMSIFQTCATPSALRSKLRLVHSCDSTFVSTYDLVQITPVGRTSSLDLLSAEVPHSDLNFDGSVNETDLALYLDDWMNDEPGADFDMDQSVSTEDLDAFIVSYMLGT